MTLEEYNQTILGLVNCPNQFSYENGITVTSIQPGYAAGELRVRSTSINPGGKVHGGALATLADTVGGCCACSKGGDCVTANCSLEFLRPAQGSVIFCEATPKKLGRALSVIAVSLRNEQGELVATGTFTFFMLGEGILQGT